MRGTGRSRARHADLAAAGLDLVVMRLVEADRQAAAAVGGVDQRPHPAGQVLLAAADEGGIGVVERPAAGVQDEPAGLLGQRPALGGRVTHRDPPRTERSESKSSRLGAAVARRGGAAMRHARRPPASRRPSSPAPGRSPGPARASRGCRRRGRTPSSTIHHEPSGAWTRSAWPVFWIGVVGAAVGEDRVGRAGLERPRGDGPRAIETAWPRSVPPSAISRYQLPPIRYRCGASGACAPGPGPQRPRRLERPPGARVDADLLDLAADRVEADAAELGVGAPAGALVVPGEVGVDAGGAVDRDRVGPGPARVVAVKMTWPPGRRHWW